MRLHNTASLSFSCFRSVNVFSLLLVLCIFCCCSFSSFWFNEQFNKVVYFSKCDLFFDELVANLLFFTSTSKQISSNRLECLHYLCWTVFILHFSLYCSQLIVIFILFSFHCVRDFFSLSQSFPLYEHKTNEIFANKMLMNFYS